ncbi:MAG TPA: UxaA family hydrolase [Chloroflexi bacterium]|jgi:altronate dehydratase large subunit|nr:UxaA family hydrolase [Chloroflexota bacterium]
MTMETIFSGYARPDGRSGVRNLLAVIPSCGCALHAARCIAAAVPGAAIIDYTGGCGETEVDTALATQLLAQIGRHPNVIGSLVVSLGCETLDAADLANRIGQGWAPVELLVIQQLGGTRRTVERGTLLARQMLDAAAGQVREPRPVSDLVIGLECGGSDATSGMAANPAMGAFSDLMVQQGAKVILAETSELIGAEHILVDRAANADVAERLLRTVAECEAYLKSTGEDFLGKQPSPGNVRGGITTVEEKALGDVLKGGTTPVVDVLRYGEPPTLPGLSFMDTPGNDPASVTALMAAGSHIVVFTTGRGNPMGNALVPVIKVTGNEHTFARMGDDMDIDASGIIRAEETFADVGRRIYALSLEVASGRQTAAEALGHVEFSMLRCGPVY